MRKTHCLIAVYAVFYLAPNTMSSNGVADLSHEPGINLLPFSGYLTALIHHRELPLIYLSSGGSIYDPANLYLRQRILRFADSPVMSLAKLPWKPFSQTRMDTARPTG